MHDTSAAEPDHDCLFRLASEQMGYFMAAQAKGCGFSTALLAHHARTGGRIIRVRRGLYRLRQYPSSPREEVLAAWLAAGRDVAVVSHESALELLGLSDVIPGAVHLTVPRSRRYRPRAPGVRVHTTTRELPASDVVVRDGIRITGPARSIADAAETGVAPDQVVAAARAAAERGMATRRQLLQVAAGRGDRVERLVRRALEDVQEPSGAGLPPGRAGSSWVREPVGVGPYRPGMAGLQAVYYRAPDGSEPVDDFINRLSVKRQVALDNQIDRLNMLTPSRPHLPFPHSSQVQGELRELRCHFGRELYRILYRRSRNLIVLLHAFRKDTGKIPRTDIEIAEARWRDFRTRMDAQRRRPPRPASHDAP